MRVRAITCVLELIGGRTEKSDRSVRVPAHASIRPVRPSVCPSLYRPIGSIPGNVGGPSGSQDNFHRQLDHRHRVSPRCTQENLSFARPTNARSESARGLSCRPFRVEFVK